MWEGRLGCCCVHYRLVSVIDLLLLIDDGGSHRACDRVEVAQQIDYVLVRLLLLLLLLWIAAENYLVGILLLFVGARWPMGLLLLLQHGFGIASWFWDHEV